MTTGTIYSPGTNVVVNGTLTNNSGHSCANDQTTQVIITDAHGNVVFGAGLGSSSNSTSWPSGTALTYTYTWNQTICNGTCAPAPAGVYNVVFTDTETHVSTPVLHITLT